MTRRPSRNVSSATTCGLSGTASTTTGGPPDSDSLPTLRCQESGSSAAYCPDRWRTPMLTIPNQLGVDYNAHVLDNVVHHLAPGLGWR